MVKIPPSRLPFILFLLGWGAALYAQPYGFLTYSVREGLPQSQVYSLVSGPQDYLWVGTQGGGVARFDGATFETFTQADGLPSDYITALDFTSDDHLLVGTNRGLSIRSDKDGKFITALLFDLPGAPSAGARVLGGAMNIRALGRWGTKTLVGTDHGLYVLDRSAAGYGLVRIFAGMGKQWIREIRAVDKQKTLIVTDRGVYALAEQADHPELLLELSGVEAILPIGDDGFWLGVAERGLLHYSTTTGELVEQPAPALRYVQRLISLPSGQMLAATRNRGLLLLNPEGEVLKNFREADGFPHPNVRDLTLDHQGRAWAATSGGGLARMIPTGLRHFGLREGLSGERVYALHQSRDSALWLGTSGGLQLLDSTSFREPPLRGSPGRPKIKTITEDEQGRIFLGTEGGGIRILDSSAITSIGVREGLPSNWILKLLPRDRGGVLAVTYADGLAEVVREDSLWRVRPYARTDALPTNSISSAIAHPEGGVLLGSSSGEVIHFREGKTVTVFDDAQGLPPGRVRALAVRRSTQLWVAVEGYGIFFTDLRMENLHFFPLPASLRPPTTSFYQLFTPVDAGEVWIGTERGVYRLFLDRNGRPDWIKHYGPEEGFLGVETCHDAVVSGVEGELWFGTMNGLTRFVRDDPNVFLDPPRVHFESIDLFYEKVDTSDYQLEGGVPQFKPRDNHFNFRFRAVDLSYPERIRYRWKLKGIETSWSPPSTDLAVRYAGLEPGKYQFSVAATTDDGKTWGEEAHYAFRITTQTWRKPWFLGVVTLAGIFLLIGTVYGLYRNVERRESKKRQALEKRNQLLKLEQQALRLQMNPHFIFNALNGIRGLVDSGQDEDASHQINRFASLMRGVLDNSRRDAISLAAEIKTLEDYLRMEQFCQPFAFDYEIQGIEGQDPEDWLLPPMILQPFVENAVLHGLSGRETPGKVTINFVLRGRRLLVTIEDDGIGRKAAAARREKRKPGHQSVALQVTEDRLRAMGGTVRLEDRQPSGTRVVLNFPVQPAW